MMKYKWSYVLGIILASIGLVVRLLTFIGAGTPLPATPSAAADTPPNVILIIVDAVRAGHVSAYGYERPTTPNLDALIAAEGALFEDAATSSPWTCPSNAAIMTGRSPSRVGATWETINNTVPAQEQTLAEYLHDAGYYTAGFISSVYCMKGAIGFGQGFDHYDDSFSDRPTSDKARAEEVNDLVIDWLDNTWTPTLSGTQPLFLLAYYFDPHSWYDPLPPYDTLYDMDYTGSITPAVFGDGETAMTGELQLTERDVEHVVALYDGEITYWDFHLEALLSHLDTVGLLQNSLIVVTTDHGEMLGEHEQWAHAGSLYEEVIRIPLLMRYSGVITPGLRIDTPVQSMDLMPTILDYAGISLPTNLQAVSLRPLLTSPTATITRPIFSEVDAITDPNHNLYWTAPRDDLRSIRQQDWKLIHHIGRLDRDELYRLEPASLYEQENLIQEEPEQASQLRSQLFQWFALYRNLLPFGRRP